MQTDYVITWVDGQNPRHKALRKFYLEEEKNKAGGIIPNREEQRCGFEQTTKIRFQDNGEIYYNIASVLLYAPFIRKIFIVTDNQTPPLLQSFIEEGKCAADFIEIVSHDDIFADSADLPPLAAARPSFNSRAIEAVLWRINGLSEHFIFSNDDFFFNAPATEQDFFINGLPRIPGRWHYSAPMQLRYFTRMLLERISSYHMPPSHSTSLWQGARQSGFFRKFLTVPHCPHSLRKSTFADFFRANPQILSKQLQFRFRSPRQFNPVSLANHLEIQKGIAPIAAKKADMAYLDEIKSPQHYAEILQKICAGATRYACIQDMGLYPQQRLAELRRILVEKLQSALPDAVQQHLLAENAAAHSLPAASEAADISPAEVPIAPL